jgi:hypothetical protein
MEPFKIFIGFSKQPSESVAEFLYDWIKRFFPQGAVETFMSEKSASKGADAENEIFDFARTANAGIFCYHANNLSSSWVHQESGFIAGNEKNKDQDNLCVPFLIYLKSGSPELVESQAYRGLLKRRQQVEWHDREAILSMLKGFNSRMKHGFNLSIKEGQDEKDPLEQRFDLLYPEMQSEFEKIAANYPPPPTNKPNNHPSKAVIPNKWESAILDLLFKRRAVNEYFATLALVYSLANESTSFTKNEIYLALELLRCKGLIKKHCGVEGFSLTEGGLTLMQEQKNLADEFNYYEDGCDRE